MLCFCLLRFLVCQTTYCHKCNQNGCNRSHPGMWFFKIQHVLNSPSCICLSKRNRGKGVRTAVRLTVKETSGNVRRTIKIWECDCIPSPFVLGIFCPQIYIPFRMKEEEQQYILAHESWHIRRHDSLWKLIAFVLLAVYWWIPFHWYCHCLFCNSDFHVGCVFLVS